MYEAECANNNFKNEKLIKLFHIYIHIHKLKKEVGVLVSVLYNALVFRKLIKLYQNLMYRVDVLFD
jgi:hypothetical protein